MPTVTHDTRYSRSPASSLPGTKLFANAVWYRSKALLKGVFEHNDSGSLAAARRSHWVPPEIWEMIIINFAHDTRTLKACAATCFTWYNIAIPLLYHTLKFRQWSKDSSRAYLGPLEALHKLGLLSFVKQVQFEKPLFGVLWVKPTLFDSERLHHFHAMNNLQDLTIADLDFFEFPAGVGEYFGHFSPTLRSAALIAPRGTRIQLLNFFRLFPGLDNVKISNYHTWGGGHGQLGTLPVPAKGRLRGRLTLKNFSDEGLLKDMIAEYGGMRFTSMELYNVQGTQLLLEACANTLETVYMRLYRGFRRPPPNFSDLSHNTALRSLEVLGSVLSDSLKHAHAVETVGRLLYTINSSALPELVVVFSEVDVRWPPRGFRQVLCDLYRIKRFRLAFCLETLEEFMGPSLRQLTLETKKAVALGRYDFLPCPPLVFSRTETGYDRLFLGDV